MYSVYAFQPSLLQQNLHRQERHPIACRAHRLLPVRVRHAGRGGENRTLRFFPWENHGETMGKPWENHGKMVILPKQMGNSMGIQAISAHHRDGV